MESTSNIIIFSLDLSFFCHRPVLCDAQDTPKPEGALGRNARRTVCADPKKQPDSRRVKSPPPSYQRLLIDLNPRSNFEGFSWLPPSFDAGFGGPGV